VVIGAELRAVRGTRAADEFTKLTSSGDVVELPPGFSARDAADAATDLLDSIRRSLAARMT
jgi:hypothetical protein